nr:tyrosine-type recombinase/integrase [Streptosporangium roseum]
MTAPQQGKGLKVSDRQPSVLGQAHLEERVNTDYPFCQLGNCHDLRHIHTTMLLLAGVPVHVVAARLGHADPSITLRVYAHMIRAAEASAADVFAKAMGE